METLNSASMKAKFILGRNAKTYSVFEIADGVPEETLKYMHEFGVLSYNVYELESYSSKWDEDGVRFILEDWTKIEGLPKMPDPPKNKTKIDGLAYEAWEKESEDKIYFAIVFRGTEDGKDWIANLRWFTRILFPKWWDQYHQVQEITGELVDFLINSANDRNKNYEIVATGHSLGGGLAQQVAYASSKVNLVFAFNPSPVTGYYDIPKSIRIINKKDTVIYRIYERGEALAYLRNIMKIFYPAPLLKTKNPKLVQLRYNFTIGKSAVSRHYMKPFAKLLYLIKKDR